MTSTQAPATPVTPWKPRSRLNLTSPASPWTRTRLSMNTPSRSLPCIRHTQQINNNNNNKVNNRNVNNASVVSNSPAPKSLKPRRFNFLPPTPTSLPIDVDIMPQTQIRSRPVPPHCRTSFGTNIVNPHSTISRRSRGRSRLAKSTCLPLKSKSASRGGTPLRLFTMPPTPNKTIAKSKARSTKKRPFHSGLVNKTSRALTPSPRKKRKLTPGSKSSAASTDSTKKYEKIHGPKFFRSCGVIGNGSFAQVFKVKDAYDKRVYALKKSQKRLFSLDAVNNALNEVNIMKLLQSNKEIIEHPKEEMDDTKEQCIGSKHVAKFYDHWISHKRQMHQLYEYYKHGTLADLVDCNNRLNYLQILEVLQQLCTGLAFVHSCGIVHIDLKPPNIFVASDHTLKIGDFGIAINTKEARFNCSGDPIYIAPELMDFNRLSVKDIDAKTDIFSLGILLLELLCDIKAPSQGKVFQDLRENIIDFSTIEPSPLTKSNVTEFRFDSKKITECEIKHAVDGKIKDLCRDMLQQKSSLRPSCVEIIGSINNILDNEKYSAYFASCDRFDELSLTPENVVKKKKRKVNADSDEKESTSDDGETFYQESPKCYETLYCRPSPHSPANTPPPISMRKLDALASPTPTPSRRKVQVDLSSIFDDCESPCIANKQRTKILMKRRGSSVFKLDNLPLLSDNDDKKENEESEGGLQLTFC